MKKINDIFGFVEKYYSIVIQYTISYQNPVQKQELSHTKLKRSKIIKKIYFNICFFMFPPSTILGDAMTGGIAPPIC